MRKKKTIAFTVGGEMEREKKNEREKDELNGWRGMKERKKVARQCVRWWIGTAASSHRVVVGPAQHTRYKPVEKQLNEVEEEIFSLFFWLVLYAYQRHWRRPDINVVHILLQNVDRTTLKIIFKASLNLWLTRKIFYFIFPPDFWNERISGIQVIFGSIWLKFKSLFSREIYSDRVQWIKNAAEHLYILHSENKQNKILFFLLR